MKYFNVADDYVASVLEACKGKPVSKIQESEAVEAETQELVEAEQHVCPLCTTTLDESISEENWAQCVDLILDTINETVEHEGEELVESEEDEEEEE
jgi:hypothetical protein